MKMIAPIVIRKGEASNLFNAQQLAQIEPMPFVFRNVSVNNFELKPHAGFAEQVHADKLEVVTPIPLGETKGAIVRYMDAAGSYAFDLAAYDSIVIPRHIRHMAKNLCDTMVVLLITNFTYQDNKPGRQAADRKEMV